MRYTKPALVMALLMNTSLSVAVGAETFASRDVRLPIPVTAKERNETLYAMRETLHGLFNLHSALAKGDFEAAALAARTNSTLLDKITPSLKERLPEEFTQLAIGLNESFRALAKETETRRNVTVTQTLLAETMTYCSGCHDTYRFDVRSSLATKR
ncbi:MAG: hypothetical protein AB1421_04495 [Pseudomonadota bacterium]